MWVGGWVLVPKHMCQMSEDNYWERIFSYYIWVLGTESRPEGLEAILLARETIFIPILLKIETEAHRS